MPRKRFLIGASISALALLAAPAALGATSKHIYGDYAENGRLDGTYSPAELRATLDDAWVQGYGHPTVLVGFRAAVEDELAGSRDEATDASAKRGSLPFTGLDVGLLAGGGAFLLLVGGSLRRLSRNQA